MSKQPHLNQHSLVLFDPLIGAYQMLPLQARVYLEVMTMKGYSTFSKAPTLLEPHHQIVKCHMQDTGWRGGLTPLKRSSRCFIAPANWAS